ncbi:MAG: hypothetical protein ACKVOM_00690 [Ferruginibacter sp.]
MATANEIEAFLQDFKEKMKIWGIFFLSRDKNLQTLLDLEISSNDREKIITQLTAADYSKGPSKDELNDGPDLWVFKKEVKGFKVYIKITLGFCNKKVICISFHT